MSSPAQKACAAGAALFATACLLALASCDRSIRPALSMEPELVIFSSHPDEIIATVTDEFRERSGLRVRVVADGTGALLKRISSGEKADVLWGGGAESLAANVDLFEPYLSPESAAILPSLREEGGRWTGFTVLPMVILVNAKLLAAIGRAHV